MRKLKLQVEELVVDSFEAVDNKAKGAGTVRGHDETAAETVCYTNMYNLSCEIDCTRGCSGPTQWNTCDGPTCSSPDCIQTQ